MTKLSIIFHLQSQLWLGLHIFNSFFASIYPKTNTATLFTFICVNFIAMASIDCQGLEH